MEGFSPNRGYSDGNHPFLRPGYLRYSGEPYGYYSFPYSYPCENMASDPPWPPSPMFAPTPFMMPHSCCMDIAYLPPVGPPACLAKPIGRGRSASKTRPTRRNRGGRQPFTNTQVLDERNYLYQAPHVQNRYMMTGFHNWSESAGPSFPPKRLNPYAYPYQYNNQCLSDEFSKPNLSRDILSEAMKEAGIGNLVISSDIAIDSKTEKSPDVSMDGQLRSVCEPSDTHPMDLTLNAVNSTANDFPSSMYFPELQQFGNVNTASEEWKFSTSLTVSRTENTFPVSSQSSSDMKKEADEHNVGQESQSEYLVKQIVSEATVPSSDLQNCSVPASMKPELLVVLSTTNDKDRDATSGVLSVSLHENQTDILNSDFPSDTNCRNAETLSPLNICKNSLDTLDLSDLPSIEDIALDFNDDCQNFTNDITIESLINSVNELCQLEGGENTIGSYYLTNSDGQIIFELHENKDKNQNAGTTKPQTATNSEKQYVNSVLLCESLNVTDHNGEAEELSDAPTSSAQCVNQTSELHPKTGLLHMPDVDVPLNIQFACNRSESMEDMLSNSTRTESNSKGQQVSQTELSFDRQGKQHTNNFTQPCVQPKPEYHVITFDPDNDVGEVSASTVTSSSIAVPVNLREESLNSKQENSEIRRKSESLPNTEIEKYDKVKNTVRNTEQKKKHRHKSKRKLDNALKEHAKKSKLRLEYDNDEVSRDSWRLVNNPSPLKGDSPDGNNEAESQNYLKAFTKKFDDLDEEVANLMAAVKPNEVWNPICDTSRDSKRMDEDIFHASIVEMASLCDATFSTIQAASESLCHATSGQQNKEDVEVIEDVGSVQVFPKQKTDDKNLVTLAVQADDFANTLLDEDGDVLENACEMSRSCCKERGQRNLEHSNYDSLSP